jgi:hypothetical protein
LWGGGRPTGAPYCSSAWTKLS